MIPRAAIPCTSIVAIKLPRPYVAQLRSRRPQENRKNALSLGALQLAPACARAFEVVRRRIQKENKRRGARKAIEPVVVGVGPVKRAVRLDLDPSIEPNRVVVIELSLHGAWPWYHRLPYTLASHRGRTGRN